MTSVLGSGICSVGPHPTSPNHAILFSETTVLETIEARLRLLAGEADNQVEMTGIGRLGEIRRRRHRCGMRMRVIETDDVEMAWPRVPSSVDVVLRVDQESIDVCREVPRPARLDDDSFGAKQHAATLGGRRLERVRDDGVERCAAHDHSASITIAMPMPPPIHSDATPYRALRAFSACTSVVRIRAPLAPIGWPRAMAPP